MKARRRQRRGSQSPQYLVPERPCSSIRYVRQRQTAGTHLQFQSPATAPTLLSHLSLSQGRYARDLLNMSDQAEIRFQYPVVSGKPRSTRRIVARVTVCCEISRHTPKRAGALTSYQRGLSRYQAKNRCQDQTQYYHSQELNSPTNMARAKLLDGL